jgi:hypothetical protein
VLFRASFHQSLGHQDESENLGPFRDDVADDLSPLALRVHGAERYDPTDAGNYKEYGERVLAKKLQNGRWQYSLRLFAPGCSFGRKWNLSVIVNNSYPTSSATSFRFCTLAGV